MAVSAVVGAIKVALKTAAKKAAIEATKQGGTSAIHAQTLQKLSVKAFTDTEAILLNRLKQVPTKALWDYTSRELGLPVSEVRKIVKKFNQTPKMKELAKASGFKNAAKGRLEEKLGVRKINRVKDVIDAVKRINENDPTRPTGQTINQFVQAQVKFLENAVNARLEGSDATYRETVDQYKDKLTFDVDFSDLFDSTKEYTEDHLAALNEIEDDIESDLEEYLSESGGDLAIIYENSDWQVYVENSTKQYIQDIRDSIKAALR